MLAPGTWTDVVRRERPPLAPLRGAREGAEQGERAAAHLEEQRQTDLGDENKHDITKLAGVKLQAPGNLERAEGSVCSNSGRSATGSCSRRRPWRRHPLLSASRRWSAMIRSSSRCDTRQAKTSCRDSRPSGGSADGSSAANCQHPQRRHRCFREGTAHAPGTRPSGDDANGSVAATCHHLQRCHQCFRKARQLHQALDLLATM